MPSRRRFLSGTIAAAATMAITRRTARAAPEPKKILILGGTAERRAKPRAGLPADKEQAVLAAWHARK